MLQNFLILKIFLILVGKKSAEQYKPNGDFYLTMKVKSWEFRYRCLLMIFLLLKQRNVYLLRRAKFWRGCRIETPSKMVKSLKWQMIKLNAISFGQKIIPNYQLNYPTLSR